MPPKLSTLASIHPIRITMIVAFFPLPAFIFCLLSVHSSAWISTVTQGRLRPPHGFWLRSPSGASDVGWPWVLHQLLHFHWPFACQAGHMESLMYPPPTLPVAPTTAGGPPHELPPNIRVPPQMPRWTVFRGTHSPRPAFPSPRRHVIAVFQRALLAVDV